MKRILFVDDEIPVLDSIRATLRRQRAEWAIDFVESGAKAIALFEKEPYDLICADMRMPEMDGAQLLTLVSARWPQAVRIVLSGYAELVQTTRLVPIAHQYLSKPCEPQHLENTLHRCLEVQTLLVRPDLRALVGRVRQLPAVPRLYSQLRATISNPNASAADVAKIVSADPGIAAKVLQIVNSAFFRLAKKISKIEQAVAYLGFTTIRNLVMSVEVFSQWSSAASLPGLDPETIQSDALLTATAARTLAAKTRFADDAVTAGLLHDIGYHVLISECADELRRAHDESLRRNIPLYQAERNIIGASHAEVGAYLLALWGLPYPIVEAVASHHEPAAAPRSAFDLQGALVIAEALTHEKSSKTPFAADRPIDEEYLLSIHAPFSWNEAQHAVQTLVSTDPQ